MSKYLLAVAFVVVSFQSCSRSWVIPDLEALYSEVEGFKHGSENEHNSAHFLTHGEKGDKGYAGEQEEEAGTKGHHDKEGHRGSYAEEGGSKKSHHHNDGYYSAHHKGDKGEKGHNFEEKGSYAKGHNTKGAHTVHKLDEFKKDTEFYDEDHDEAHKQKYGGYEEEYGSSSGKSTKSGHHKKAFLEGEFAKNGKGEEGSYYAEDSGHKKSAGHEEHYADQEKFGKEAGNDEFKKWGFEH